MFKHSIIPKRRRKTRHAHSIEAYPLCAPLNSLFSHRHETGHNTTRQLLTKSMGRQRLKRDLLDRAKQKCLAQDIHDDLGQLVGALKIELSRLSQDLPRNDKKLQTHVDIIGELANAMTTSVQRILAGLPPKALDDMGLGEALEALARDFESRHPIHCVVSSRSVTEALPPHIAATTYRVIQEALNNVVKHANAQTVYVALEVRHKHLLLTIVDNGTGMPEAGRLAEGFGLTGMRERVNAVRGRMRLASDANGTSLRVVIPMASEGAT